MKVEIIEGNKLKEGGGFRAVGPPIAIRSAPGRRIGPREDEPADFFLRYMYIDRGI